MWDAASVYNTTAKPIYAKQLIRRPESEQTNANRNLAVALAVKKVRIWWWSCGLRYSRLDSLHGHRLNTHTADGHNYTRCLSLVPDDGRGAAALLASAAQTVGLAAPRGCTQRIDGPPAAVCAERRWWS